MTSQERLRTGLKRWNRSGHSWRATGLRIGKSKGWTWFVAHGHIHLDEQTAEEIIEILPEYIWEAGKELEGRVWHIVRHRLGPENAIRQSEVAQKIGVADTREVRLITLSLLEQGFPVGTTTHRPYGIYRMSQEEHKEAYVAQLLGRVSGTLYRVKLVEALDFSDEKTRQLEMELQPELI